LTVGPGRGSDDFVVVVRFLGPRGAFADAEAARSAIGMHRHMTMCSHPFVGHLIRAVTFPAGAVVSVG
jgi:hypothetical protein